MAFYEKKKKKELNDLVTRKTPFILIYIYIYIKVVFL